MTAGVGGWWAPCLISKSSESPGGHVCQWPSFLNWLPAPIPLSFCICFLKLRF